MPGVDDCASHCLSLHLEGFLCAEQSWQLGDRGPQLPMKLQSGAAAHGSRMKSAVPQ